MNRPTKWAYYAVVSYVLFFLPVLARAETLTLTTYYPAPFGAYDQIRLVPRAAQSGSCSPGTMYVRSDTGNIEFCNSGGTWGPAPGVWLQSGNNIYPATYATANVGIGTTTATQEQLMVHRTSSVSGEEYAVHGEILGGGTGIYNGMVGYAANTGPASELIGVHGIADISGPETFSTGVLGGAVVRPASTASNAYGIVGLVAVNGPVSGSVSAIVADTPKCFVGGVWIPCTGSAGGAVANVYGLFIGDQAGATNSNNNYALYYSDATPEERVVVTAAGNVGIGVIAPATSIHVQKLGDSRLWLDADSDNAGGEGDNPSIYMSQDANGNGFLIGMVGTAGQDPLESVYSNTTADAMFIGDPGGGGLGSDLQFGVNNAVRMTIDDVTGNVGIGSTNPLAKLDVNAGSGGIRIITGNEGGGKVLTWDAGGYADWKYITYAP